VEKTHLYIAKEIRIITDFLSEQNSKEKNYEAVFLKY
jgi:hypothetical protein